MATNLLKLTFYIENNQLLTISGLADQTGALISSATVTATLYDPSGAVVTGFSNVPFSAVLGQAGTYQASLPANLMQVAPSQLGAGYNLKLQGFNSGTEFTINIASSLKARVM